MNSGLKTALASLGGAVVVVFLYCLLQNAGVQFRSPIALYGSGCGDCGRGYSAPPYESDRELVRHVYKHLGP